MNGNNANVVNIKEVDIINVIDSNIEASSLGEYSSVLKVS